MTTGECIDGLGGPVGRRHPQRALCKSLGMFSRCDPSSPYIHPVGWCHEHGKPLTPPQGGSGSVRCSLGVHSLGNRLPRVVWGSWGHKPPAKAPVHMFRCSMVLVLGQISTQI